MLAKDEVRSFSQALSREEMYQVAAADICALNGEVASHRLEYLDSKTAPEHEQRHVRASTKLVSWMQRWI
ncbi:hypothetical protein ELH58_10170 [Rhizobium ruizarguesonis]|uniref:hypothetical protein n=1 Tax=Rhizobium TaxID=379 RepID=UPI00103181C8|nr:hypothetical protein [Rhizobium ruizarguesonis]TBA68922.1 hypothetical protein ELH58_10170 [Rhizobium ruizarguesonis]